jgi:hypothetical protein
MEGAMRVAKKMKANGWEVKEIIQSAVKTDHVSPSYVLQLIDIDQPDGEKSVFEKEWDLFYQALKACGKVSPFVFKDRVDNNKS